MAVQVGIIGAAGFAGIEAVRLTLAHPEFQLAAISSNELAGTPLSQVYPSFTDACDLAFCTHDDPALLQCDVVILAVPHTAAMAQAPAFVERGVVVIDLSADFRLKDPSVFEEWYNTPHTQTDLLAQAAFGLPELFREDLAQAHETHKQGHGVLVGCAGCYPTASSLAAAPFIRSGLLGTGAVVVDAVSGVTGAGKKANQRTHYCFADEDVEAYGVTSHRHTPEIEQILGLPNRVVFTPHLGPYKRGILSTVTMPLEGSFDTAAAHKLYADFYKDSPFVSVLDEGAQPRTASVTGTNRAHIAVVVDAHRKSVIATCAIDNLCKGAAGQGIQCANIVCGLPETCGLESVALPV